MELPGCDYRVAIAEASAEFFCRHSQQLMRAPTHVVTAVDCQSCAVREQPCPDPRPVPSAEELARLPRITKQVWDLARSLVWYAADGFRNVSREEYAQRIEICTDCSRRVGARCLECGCGLVFKARGRAFQCPLGKWPIPGGEGESMTRPPRSVIEHVDRPSNAGAMEAPDAIGESSLDQEDAQVAEETAWRGAGLA